MRSLSADYYPDSNESDVEGDDVFFFHPEWNPRSPSAKLWLSFRQQRKNKGKRNNRKPRSRERDRGEEENTSSSSEREGDTTDIVSSALSDDGGYFFLDNEKDKDLLKEEIEIEEEPEEGLNLSPKENRVMRTSPEQEEPHVGTDLLVPAENIFEKDKPVVVVVKVDGNDDLAVSETNCTPAENVVGVPVGDEQKVGNESEDANQYYVTVTVSNVEPEHNTVLLQLENQLSGDPVEISGDPAGSADGDSVQGEIKQNPDDTASSALIDDPDGIKSAELEIMLGTKPLTVEKEIAITLDVTQPMVDITLIEEPKETSSPARLVGDEIITINIDPSLLKGDRTPSIDIPENLWDELSGVISIENPADVNRDEEEAPDVLDMTFKPLDKPGPMVKTSRLPMRISSHPNNLYQLDLLDGSTSQSMIQLPTPSRRDVEGLRRTSLSMEGGLDALGDTLYEDQILEEQPVFSSDSDDSEPDDEEVFSSHMHIVQVPVPTVGAPQDYEANTDDAPPTPGSPTIISVGTVTSPEKPQDDHTITFADPKDQDDDDWEYSSISSVSSSSSDELSISSVILSPTLVKVGTIAPSPTASNKSPINFGNVDSVDSGANVSPNIKSDRKTRSIYALNVQPYSPKYGKVVENEIFPVSHSKYVGQDPLVPEVLIENTSAVVLVE